VDLSRVKNPKIYKEILWIFATSQNRLKGSFLRLEREPT
jgi:hypothetical protein